MGLQILATAMALPKHVQSNKDFEAYLDTSDEWIQTRTGIKNRRFSKVKEEDTSALAIQAAKDCVRNLSDAEKAKIKAVFVASVSPDYIMPSISSLVHHALHLDGNGSLAVDINMACTGFLGALKLAHGAIEEGEYALVVASDVLSKIVDQEDRSSAVLFGDGAGSVLVKKDEKVLLTDALVVEDRKKIVCFGNTIEEVDDHYIHMQGQDVYRFAVSEVPESMRRLAEKAKIALDDFRYFLLHQANWRILEQVSRRLGQEEEKFPIILDQYGNTSASSIPILLHDLVEKDALAKGDKLLLSSFGAGLQVISLVLEWSI